MTPRKSMPNKSQLIAAQLQQAIHLYVSGNMTEAEKLYDAVLKLDPKEGNALNLKGVIVLERGDTKLGMALLDQAVRSLPNFAAAHFNRGNAFAAAGLHAEALKSYEQSIALDGSSADARVNAGALLESLGRVPEAVNIFRAAVRDYPTDTRVHRNLALCLVKELNEHGRDDREALQREAMAAFDRALTLDAANADLRFDCGNFLTRCGDHTGAVTQFEHALAMRPDWIEAGSNLGEALRHLGRHEEAVTTQRDALRRRPDDQMIQIHLGNALLDARQFAEAEQIFRRLTEERPNDVIPYMNLGCILRDTNRYDDAAAMFEKALLRAPGSPDGYTNIGATFAHQGWFAMAHLLHRAALARGESTPQTKLNLGLAALALGWLDEGWKEYEARFDVAEENVSRHPEPPPHWQGEDLSGKGIVILTEQGIGDEILYAEMLPDIVARADHCVIVCSERLVPVFVRSFPNCRIISNSTPSLPLESLGPVHFQASAASLGQYLRPNLARFPRRPGYLRADPAKVAELRAQYRERAGGRRIVGISWRSAAPRSGAEKSLALENLAPILETPSTSFFSLQYGDTRDEIAAMLERLGIEVFRDPAVDPLTDLDIFFAQAAAMDLIITTSSTTAHVAGALNVPLWIMLPFGKGAHWYWFLQTTETPWYPSAHIFRQSRADKSRPWWQDAVPNIAARLKDWAKN